MDTEIKKFLPIGTVVTLKGITRKLMITGFCSHDEGNNSKTFDYTGCFYPEGIISSRQMALFDHSQIDKIYYLGYTNEEETVFKQNLVASLNEMIKDENNN